MVTPEESKRLHLDWWGKCRTCKWWSTPTNPTVRPNMDGFTCLAEDSTLHLKSTTSNGYCGEWDSFDPDVALKVLSEGTGSK